MLTEISHGAFRAARCRPSTAGEDARRYSIGQRKFRRQLAYAHADFVRGVHVFDVHQHLGNHVGNRGHLRLLHATRRAGGCAQTDTAGLERRAGLERNRVLVRRDACLIERDLRILAGDVFRAHVHEHEMVVRAAADEAEAVALHAIGQRRRIFDDLLLVSFE